MSAVVRIDTTEPVPSWEGYEWARGVADVAVDPEHPANAGIVDLDLAPRFDGLVTFDVDVRMLRPVGGGNGGLLCVVPNRGMAMGVPFSVDVPAAAVTADPPHAGDGFLLAAGWSVVWIGWQWDIVHGLGLRAPLADVGPGWTRAEYRIDEAQDTLPLSDAMLIPFADTPTADLHDPDAVLTVRTAPDAPRVVIPRDEWHFPDASNVALSGGFQPFVWYELVYRSAHSPVVGAGLLAVRDVAAAVRRDFDRAIGFGVSQSGRFLRQFLWEGRNVDEQGAQVFDGVLADIASSRRGEFNHRYANPSYTHAIGFSNLPPFATSDLLDQQRSVGGAPKIIETNTSWEYWRGDGALVHVDPVTGDDLPDDPDARVYLVAGHDHLPTLEYKSMLPAANPVHGLTHTLVLRALFTALDEWVVGGDAPPPSEVPRRGDGTAVTRAAVLSRFAHVPRPDPAVLNVTRRLDLGPDADRGIGRWPVRTGEPFVALVADVDEDGNERCGIRLPEVAAPVAVYTGWNPRRPVEGLPDVLFEMLGSQLPFPPDRPTVTARYVDDADYVAHATRAAEALVEARFLLPADVDRAVASAVARYREIATQPS